MLRFWTVWWNNMNSLEAKSIIILLSFLFYLRNISFCDDFMDLNRSIVEAKKIKLDNWILRAVATAEDVANSVFSVFRSNDNFCTSLTFLRTTVKASEEVNKWINKWVSEWESCCVREGMSEQEIDWARKLVRELLSEWVSKSLNRWGFFKDYHVF